MCVEQDFAAHSYPVEGSGTASDRYGIGICHVMGDTLLIQKMLYSIEGELCVSKIFPALISGEQTMSLAVVLSTTVSNPCLPRKTCMTIRKPAFGSSYSLSVAQQSPTPNFRRVSTPPEKQWQFWENDSKYVTVHKAVSLIVARVSQYPGMNADLLW